MSRLSKTGVMTEGGPLPLSVGFVFSEWAGKARSLSIGGKSGGHLSECFTDGTGKINLKRPQNLVP